MSQASDTRDDMAISDGRSEALLSLVVDLTDDAVISCDTRSDVTFFSTSAERLFGRQRSEILGKQVFSLFPSHLTGEIVQLIATVVAGERIRHFESEIVRPDGLPVPVSLSLAPLPDESTTGDAGRDHGWVLVARDVTEQHLAQAALAEVDSRLEEGEAAGHVGSWLWDLRTDAVQWSLEFHRIHDIDPLDFPGTFESYLDLIVHEDRTMVRRAMTQSVETSTPIDLEYRILDTHDMTRLIRIVAQPTLGSHGRAVGLRGIGHDVTDASAHLPGTEAIR